MTLPRPQRIIPPSAPGSLLKRFDAPVSRIDARIKSGHDERDPDYLAMVRQCPCLKCGMEPSEAAHVRFASAAFGKASGLSKKPDDRHSLPLCTGCHRLDRDAQHNRGERLFWAELGINPLIVCQQLYAQRGDLVAMRAVIFSAIAGRGKMTSATGIMSYLNLTRLVEEVPGVPASERYYLWHKHKVEARFASYQQGVNYAAEHGITIDQFEAFEQ